MTATTKPKVAFTIPDDAPRALCRSCGEPFAWVTMKSGKANPIETEGAHVGESHFAHCPGAGQHRKVRGS